MGDSIFMLDMSPAAIAMLFIVICNLLPSLRAYIRNKPGQEVPGHLLYPSLQARYLLIDLRFNQT